jgi:hypothetical protein
VSEITAIAEAEATATANANANANAKTNATAKANAGVLRCAQNDKRFGWSELVFSGRS